MIITVRHLQIIHYYYFAIGMFSLTNAFFIGFDSIFSLIFIVFYAINSGVSWYIASVARKRMKDYIILQSLVFSIKHIVVTVASVAVTTLVWVSGIIPDVGLLNTLLMANYFVLFLAGMWYMIIKTDLAKGYFTIYDNLKFRRSKEFIIKVRNEHNRFFGRELVTDNVIRAYRFGSVMEVDNNMISAWRNKDNLQYALGCMGMIELALARNVVDDLRGKVLQRGAMPSTPDNQRILSGSQRELEEEERDIMEYEKVFYRKTGQGEFL